MQPLEARVLLSGPGIGPEIDPEAVEVSSLSLANDTDTPGDGVTSDATLQGSVVNDGPVDGQTVQFDLDGDGTVDDSVTTDSNGDFVYDGNDTITPGTLTVYARGYDNDDNLYGAWVGLSFTFDPEPVEVTSLVLSNDTDTPGDNITTDATLEGTISNDGSIDQQTVEFDFDGDGYVDDMTFTDVNGGFTYDGNNGMIPIGSITVYARGYEYDANTDLYGEWVALSFTFEPEPVEVTSLVLSNDTGTAGDNITSDASFQGTISNDGSVEAQTIEFDFDGDGLVDDIAYSDSNGEFTLDANNGSISPGQVTVYARGYEYDYDLGLDLYGEWVALTFTFEPEPVEVTTLALSNDTGTPGDNITTDATFQGTISNDGSVESQLIEFDFDGDGLVDDFAYSDSNGEFTLDANASLTPGVLTIYARGYEYDSDLGLDLYGEWVSLTFTLVAAP